MGPFSARGGDEADHMKSQFRGRQAYFVACGSQVQGLPRIPHQGDVQYGMRQCGGPHHAHPGTGPPPLGMGCEGDAGDHGALGADCLGCRQGSRTYAPCVTHKPCPVREDASAHNPLTPHAAQDEHATAEDDIGTGHQAADLPSSAQAGSTT